MKVQIEIKEEALSIAILSIGTMAKSETDSGLLEQAVERCKNEVTEIDIEKHDKDMSLQIALALFAITQTQNQVLHLRRNERGMGQQCHAGGKGRVLRCM